MTQERPRDPQIVRGNGVAFHGADQNQQQRTREPDQKRTPDLGQGQHGGRSYPQRQEVSRAPYGQEMSRGNPPRGSERDSRGGTQMGDLAEGRRQSHRRDFVESDGGVARLRGGGTNPPSSVNPAYDLSGAGRTPLEGTGSTKRLKTGEILLNATRLNNGPPSGVQ